LDELTELNGAWKGLIVSRSNSILVHVWLEFQSETLRGRYELSEVDGPSSRGEIEGSRRGSEITGRTSTDLLFEGRLIETSSVPMILGVARPAASHLPFAAVTLFHATGEFGPIVLGGYGGVILG
jgi:hypothetical protein